MASASSARSSIWPNTGMKFGIQLVGEMISNTAPPRRSFKPSGVRESHRSRQERRPERRSDRSKPIRNKTFMVSSMCLQGFGAGRPSAVANLPLNLGRCDAPICCAFPPVDGGDGTARAVDTRTRMRASAAVAEAASRRCAILPALELGCIAADVSTVARAVAWREQRAGEERGRHLPEPHLVSFSDCAHKSLNRTDTCLSLTFRRAGPSSSGGAFKAGSMVRPASNRG